jgi:enediyne biosynthesis protein E4
MLKPPRVATIFALLACFSVISILGPTGALARDWVVPDQAPTIQSAMDSCVTGDVVVIQAGLYEDCTHLSNGALHIAVLPSGVSVRGATGDPADVVLDAGFLGRCFETRNSIAEFSIEDITMRRGRAFSPLGKGGAVFAMFSSPVFRNCVFDSNYADFGGGAISVGYGDSLVVENCIFNGNETDGIGAAVQVSNTRATITSSTFYGSRGSSVHYSNEDLALDKCIIAAGDAEALVQNSESDPDPELNCCDIFGNEEDYSDFFAEQLDQNGNVSVDPLFCNPMFGDLHLSAVSACAPENSGDCGLIGALIVGCGTGASTYVIRPDGSGDFPTIQAAINIAVVGDTIVLADGVFTGDGNRDLDFLGKAIAVQGQSGDPELAIIDCQGTLEESHRGFIFQTDEVATSFLRNISITNGNVPDEGGAILCKSSPVIENCRFYENHADYGGGIYVDHGSPVIKNCEFSQNEGRAKGGGMGLFASEAEISNSLFTANWGYMGAAIFLPDSSDVVMTSCTITNNANSLDKATIGLDGNSILTISNSIVAFGPHYAFGEYDQGSVEISGCDVFGHGAGDYTGPISGDNGSSGNISADPLYCDGASRDFTLRGDSPCSEHSSPNRVQIGNYPVGCPAPSIFSDLSENLPEAAALSSGVNLLDWNGDGHLDLMITNEDSPNEAYDGAGNWNFNSHAEDFSTFPSGSVAAAFSDYDADGDLDLYLSTRDMPNFLGENHEGVFTGVMVDSLQRTFEAGSSSWCDHNGDGHLDMFITATDSSSVLMTSDGEGDYTNSTAGALAAVGNCVGVAWADYDNDGDQDLYVVQDNQPDKLIKNDEEFTLIEGSPLENAGAGRSASWADYDNDGDLDLYLVIDGGTNQLLQNGGGDSFSAVQNGPLADDGPGRSGIWGDWDNDGDLDLFLTNFGAGDHLLRNNNGSFSDTQDTVFANPDSSEGAAWGDIDNDGDLDLAVGIRGGRTRLYRNNTLNDNHWLKLDLRSLHGMVGSVAARVQITTGVDTIQIREVAAGGGWRSSDDFIVHFGLGAEAVIDTVKVTWPGGQPLILNNVEADQLLVLVEEFNQPTAVPEHLTFRSFRLERAYPNPFNPSTNIRFAVPKSDRVSVRIYDVAGRLVKVLVDEQRAAGEHSVVWRGRDRNDRTVAAGVYFVRLESGRFATSRSLTLVK